MGQERLAYGSERHTARVTVQQAAAKITFELANLLRDS
jgi:hypothetical protein